MAKKTPSSFVNRKHIARNKREAEERRRILMALGALGAVIVVILAWGLLQTYYFTPRQPIAVVNGAKITRQDYQKRVLYERDLLDEQMQLIQQQYQQFADTFKDSPDLLKSFKDQTDQQLNQLYSQRINLDRQVLDEMIEEQLTMQEAEKRGITVTDADVSATYDRIAAARAGGFTEPSAQETVTARQNATATAAMFTPTPTLSTTTAITPTAVRPTPTINVISGDALAKARADWEAKVQQSSGMSPAELREVVRRQLIRQKVREAIMAEADTTGLQAHARHIMVDTEEEAKKVKERLDAGEDFAAVAKEVSKDTTTAPDGGDLGWFPQGVMVPAFDEAAFSLPVGAISDPIQSQFGWHILQVMERGEHELDQRYLSAVQTKAYNDWLKDARTTADIQDNWVAADAPPDPLLQQQQAQQQPLVLPTVQSNSMGTTPTPQ